MFHMWEFLLLLSHCVFTCEVTVFCYADLCCSCSLNFTCEYFTVSHVNALGYSAAAFLTVFHMWTHLVSHVRKLTVLRLHLVFTREVVNHFRHPSFSLNSHVWINYLMMQGVLKQQRRCKQLWLDYSKIIILYPLPIGIFCTLCTN
jgi:hypothetical protein